MPKEHTAKRKSTRQHITRQMNIVELANFTVTDETRFFLSFGIYIFCLIVIGIIHHFKEGKEAWTPSRKEAWRSTIFNCMLGCLCISTVSYFHAWGRLRDDWGGVTKILMEFIAFVLMEDFLFYWAHRGLHSNMTIYKLVHAYHHISHKDVTLVNGMQVTPAEFFLSLFLPGVLPLFFVPMNRFVWEFTCWISTFGVICDHGLDVFPHIMIPFPINGTEHHKRHHERVRGNYSGPLSIWDFICNTHFKEIPLSARKPAPEIIESVKDKNISINDDFVMPTSAGEDRSLSN